MKIRVDRKVISIKEPLEKVIIELSPSESSLLSRFLKNNVEYSHVPFLKELRDRLSDVHSS